MKTLEHISEFDKVGDYFVSLIDRIREDRESDDFSFYQPKNIDCRIKKDRFFYFPNEGSFTQKNCFEQNMDFYLALEKIYPSSKPRLINLLIDDVNLHSGILFTHNNQVHFADPIQKIIGPAKINSDLIEIEKNLYSHSKKKIKFKKIFQVENQSLEKIITNLREPQGIIDFFYGSGQIASRIYDWPYHKELFIHIDDNLNICGQIRTEDACKSKDNSLIKLIYNPFEDKYLISTHSYHKSNWQIIENIKSLTSNKSSNSHFEISIAIANYLKKTNMKFSSNSNLKSKLENLEKLPKDFIESLNYDDNVLNYYLDYVLEEEGENFGRIYEKTELFFQSLIVTKGEEKKQEEKLSKEDTKKIMFKEINDRNRFQLFRLAYDFKKYCRQIKQNL